MTSLRVKDEVSPARWFLPVASPYNLTRTLSCGQVFRWHSAGSIATGIFAGRPVRVVQVAGGLSVEGLTEREETRQFRRYLGLDEPLATIEGQLAHDAVLRGAIKRSSGIALMRQDPWECLISFIISAFNNIPKIEQSLGRLAARFGNPVGEGWSFPTPERLASASLRSLRACWLGYRAPYVRSVARQVANREVDLATLEDASFAEARKTLLALPGVGEKVADCVLLFAYGHGVAFPVDVWIQRVVERRYFGGRPQTPRHLRAFAQARFGSLAGYAQQHLYFSGRASRSRRLAETALAVPRP